MDEIDLRHLRRALELASLSRGAVEPNPLVGAVVARGESVLGEGRHERFGGPHAEVVALRAAGASAEGATLYATLEPCCHHGKTPPCTDAVLASKVARVVVATVDPFPKVCGRGLDVLRRAGVVVELGGLEGEAKRLNAPYFKRVRSGRPYVHAKWAMSLDGRIATASGQSKWITGEEARRHAYAFRGLMDAVVVGVHTALADNPLLTPRPPGPRIPARIVLDSSGRTPLDSQLVRTAADAPTVIAATKRASAERLGALANAGCETIVLSADSAGRVSIPALLDELGKREFTNILVEGGARVLGSFLDAGEVDAVRAYVAPCLVGGEGASPPIAGRGFQAVSDVLRLEAGPPTPLGLDLFLEARRPVE
jgi:diaminohydroxyphosphoribosylaminopyrimidine deaminase/5-amino-6-(5-phosphoribosylamino)uracil reductase